MWVVSTLPLEDEEAGMQQVLACHRMASGKSCLISHAVKTLWIKSSWQNNFNMCCCIFLSKDAESLKVSGLLCGCAPAEGNEGVGPWGTPSLYSCGGRVACGSCQAAVLAVPLGGHKLGRKKVTAREIVPGVQKGSWPGGEIVNQ